MATEGAAPSLKIVLLVGAQDYKFENEKLSPETNNVIGVQCKIGRVKLYNLSK